MRTRLTPLNIVSSLILVTAVYAAISEGPGWSTVALLIAAFVLCFLIDLMFRRLIADLKRIWLYELVFVIFVAGLIFLLKA